jgi:hypothetical protein
MQTEDEGKGLRLPIMKKQFLISRIKACFPLESKLRNNDIVFDNTGTDGGRERIKKDFYRKQWDKIPDTLLEYHWDAFSSFTPEAYCYFLPGYMMFVINKYPETGSLIADMIFRYLCPNKSDDIGAFDFEDRINCLDDDQRAVIKEFFEYLIGLDPDIGFTREEREEVIRYWKLSV